MIAVVGEADFHAIRAVAEARINPRVILAHAPQPHGERRSADAFALHAASRPEARRAGPARFRASIASCRLAPRTQRFHSTHPTRLTHPTHSIHLARWLLPALLPEALRNRPATSRRRARR